MIKISNRKKRFLVILLFFIFPFNVFSLPIAVESIKRSDYQPDHYGIIKVKATLFSTPCNIRYYITKDKRHEIIQKNKIYVKGKLVNCGAGDAFKSNVFESLSAKTPVNIKLLDIKSKRILKRFGYRLNNGSNIIPLPTLIGENYQLEISYE